MVCLAPSESKNFGLFSPALRSPSACENEVEPAAWNKEEIHGPRSAFLKGLSPKEPSSCPCLLVFGPPVPALSEPCKRTSSIALFLFPGSPCHPHMLSDDSSARFLTCFTFFFAVPVAQAVGIFFFLCCFAFLPSPSPC